MDDRAAMDDGDVNDPKLTFQRSGAASRSPSGESNEIVLAHSLQDQEYG